MHSELEIALDAHALLAEGPIWEAGRESLLWVDIPRGEVHRYFPEGGHDRVVASLEVPVGAVANAGGGRLLLAAGMGFGLLEEATGAIQWIGSADRGDRMNDATCDPAGRFLAGTMTDDRRPAGAALYRLDLDRSIVEVLGGVTLSNGIGWSPDGQTMYYVDTPTEVVEAFDYDVGDGSVTGRRKFVDLSSVPGRPDGLTVDAEGGVWVAMANGWSVRRYGSTGRLEDLVDLPVQKVTSCTFGGRDLGELYITSASFGLSEAELAAQPHAGALFRCRPGVTGLPANVYAG